MNLVFLKKARFNLVFWAMLLCFFIACGDESKGGGGRFPLSSPQSVQVTGKHKTLEIRWTRLAPAQGIEAEYEVWYGTENNLNTADKLPDNVRFEPDRPLCEAAITDLENGTTYYVWIRAIYGSLGKAPFSSAFFGMPVPIPAIPVNLKVTAGETLFETEWDSVEYAFSYEVTCGAAIQIVSEPFAVFTGLNNGTTYDVKVKAINTAGESDFSSVVSGIPEAALSAPSAPGVLTVESGNRRLFVTWNTVAGAVKYELYYNTVEDPATATLFGDVSPGIPKVNAGFRGLTNEIQYYVWVRAWNSHGYSDYSPVGSGVPTPKDIPVNYSNFSFILGEATAEYVFAEFLPLSAFDWGGRSWDRLTRTKETALGNLFTDAAAWYAKEHLSENIDFVFLNGSYIDNAISKGQITVARLLGSVRPTNRNDTFTFLTLKGSDVETLFDMAATLPARMGRGGFGTDFWAIVSEEVNYTIQYLSPPAGTPENFYLWGERNTWEKYAYGTIKPGTLKIHGLAVDPNKNYRIATTSELASGAFYTILALKGTNVRATTKPFWHGVAEYIYEQGVVTPITPAEPNCRITTYGGVPLGSTGCNY